MNVWEKLILLFEKRKGWKRIQLNVHTLRLTAQVRSCIIPLWLHSFISFPYFLSFFIHVISPLLSMLLSVYIHALSSCFEATQTHVLKSEQLSVLLLTPLLTAVLLLPTHSSAILTICSSFLKSVIHGFLSVAEEVTGTLGQWVTTHPHLLWDLVSY